MLFFLFQQQQQNTISILVVLLEGKVLSNKAEAEILTLLLLVRAKKILSSFSHHPFHSFLSQKNALQIFVKLMQFSHFVIKSLDYESCFLKKSNLQDYV